MNQNDLKNIADKRQDFGYTKSLTHEELAELKTELSEKAISVSDLKADLKDYSTEIKRVIKPLAERKAELIATIKAKAIFVNEPCSILFDHETNMATYYSEVTGEEVHSRPLAADERQTKMKLTVNQ